MASIYRTYAGVANDKLFALGSPGVIAYSADGVNWTTAQTGSSSDITSVTYGNGRYVVVGWNGFVAHSTDLAAWSTVSVGTSVILNHVNYVNSVFLAVGNNGAIYSSTDGITWTARTSGVTTNLVRVKYLNAKYIIVGASGTLLSSTNYTTWTAVIPPSVDARPLYGIAYRAGATYPYTTGKKVSTDGVNWTSVYSNDTSPTTGVNYYTGSAIATGNTSTTDTFKGYLSANATYFVRHGLGDLGVPTYHGRSGYGSYSTNGSSFALAHDYSYGFAAGAIVENKELNGRVALFSYWDGVNDTLPYASDTQWGSPWFLQNGTYTDTAYGGTYTFTNLKHHWQRMNQIYGSDTPPMWDGYQFNTSTTDTNKGWVSQNESVLLTSSTQAPSLGYTKYNCFNAAYGNGYYIFLYAFGNASINIKHIAYRGTTVDTVGYTPWYSYPYPLLSQVAAFANNTVKFPTEIGTWSSTTSYTQLQFGMAFGAGRFVVVGPRRTANTGTTLNGSGTKYFYVVYSADNGVTWNETYFAASAGYDVGGRVAGSTNEIVMSCKWYNNGTPGWVMRTTDCVNYSYYYTGYASIINEIKYLNGYFYTVHDNGGIARSSNGITWTTLVAGANTNLYSGNLIDVDYINAKYVIYAEGGIVQTTTDLASFTNSTGGPGSPITKFGTTYYAVSTTGYAQSSTDGVTWSTTAYPVNGTSLVSNSSKFLSVVYGSPSGIYVSANLSTWTQISLITTSNVGIIIRDAGGIERLQSYDPAKVNYLCTRVIQENYVTADNTTVYVTGADGQKIFVNVTPATNSSGGMRIPYIEYHRGSAPNYQAYYIVKYPAWGGSGSSIELCPVYCTTFSTGAVEKITY